MSSPLRKPRRAAARAGMYLAVTLLFSLGYAPVLELADRLGAVALGEREVGLFSRILTTFRLLYLGPLMGIFLTVVPLRRRIVPVDRREVGRMALASLVAGLVFTILMGPELLPPGGNPAGFLLLNCIYIGSALLVLRLVVPPVAGRMLEGERAPRSS